jgi:energy-coupling factor transport system permease protein
MKLSLYLEKDTLIHRLDPRTKIVSSLLLILCALIFNHPLYLAAIFFLILLISLVSSSIKQLLKLKYLLFLLTFFSLILWPFFVKGKSVLFYLLSYPVYKESFYYGLAMGIRLICFVIVGLIYVSTTKNEETTYGLIAFGLPYAFSFAISVALRLVPTFVDTALTIVEAQISRGLDLESKNPLKRIKVLLPLAVPMFVTAIRKTNMLGVALESRGFNPSSKRTFYLQLKMERKDLIALLSVLSFSALCFYIRVFLGLGVIIKGRI